MRIFYWAAYYGNEGLMTQLVRDRRWSPFIKSYKNRSVISGAIWGGKTEVVRYLLGTYKFNEVHADQQKDFAATVFNKDQHDNNCLHYCYMVDLPEVREILREFGYFNERSQRLNRRGQLPSQLRHSIKAEDSNEETEDENYDAQEEALNNFFSNAIGGLGVIGQSIGPEE